MLLIGRYQTTKRFNGTTYYVEEVRTGRKKHSQKGVETADRATYYFQ